MLFQSAHLLSDAGLREVELLGHTLLRFTWGDVTETPADVLTSVRAALAVR